MDALGAVAKVQASMKVVQGQDMESIAKRISSALNWPLDMLEVSIWSDDAVESANMLLVNEDEADVVDIRPLDDDLLQNTPDDGTGLVKIECRILNDYGVTSAMVIVYVFAGNVYLHLPKELEHPVVRAVANAIVGGVG